MSTGNTIPLKIDGRDVDAAPGQTVLDVARAIGIDIPTLCFLEQCSPSTSCLACVVKVTGGGPSRLVPSCATKVQPGMNVESETPEVHEARRTAIELLLSDHVGDCLSPCHRICPLRLNIPVMFRQVEAGLWDDAIAHVRGTLPLAAVLGRLCNRPCENGCRRGTWDSPAAIRDLERYVAELDLESANPYLPPCKGASGKSVVIVGAGPVGLAAAFQLRRDGHSCTVVDRHKHGGGSLMSAVNQGALPARILEREIVRLERLGVQFRFEVELGKTVTLEGLERGFDAILLATGELTKPEAETLGLASSGSNGIKLGADTFQSSNPRLFAAGSIIKPIKQIARAMSEGVAVAICLDQWFRGLKVQRREKYFCSVMGRLDDAELKLFIRGYPSYSRVEPVGGAAATFSQGEAQAESVRCLHCDCRAASECKLQHYAQILVAEQNRFRTQRPRFEQQVQPGGVIFEAGKCIVCGICVQLAERAREPLGLTFIGRGFEVRVGVPLDQPIEQGLKTVAKDCVENCPTGALTFGKPSACKEPGTCDPLCSAEHKIAAQRCSRAETK